MIESNIICKYVLYDESEIKNENENIIVFYIFGGFLKNLKF